ncbi:hypothetical protein ATANTOWER_025410, partial [Ataeniobius toweri]|nr:hypothetical protein [Ataeniobius toweri]
SLSNHSQQFYLSTPASVTLLNFSRKIHLKLTMPRSAETGPRTNHPSILCVFNKPVPTHTLPP